MLHHSRTRFTMASNCIPSTRVPSCAHTVNMARPSTSSCPGEGKTVAGCEAARLIAASTSAGMGIGAAGGAGGKAACDDDGGKYPAPLPPTVTTPYQGNVLAASSSAFCTAAAAAGVAAGVAP